MSESIGDGAFARHVIEAIGAGPICVKCIATTRGLTRGAVEAAVATLRTTFVLQSTEPCRLCGMRETLALNPAA